MREFFPHLLPQAEDGTEDSSEKGGLDIPMDGMVKVESSGVQAVCQAAPGRAASEAKSSGVQATVAGLSVLTLGVKPKEEWSDGERSDDWRSPAESTPGDLQHPKRAKLEPQP